MPLCVLTSSNEEQMKELFSFFASLKPEEKEEKAPEELVALLSLVVKDFSLAFKKAEPALLEGAFNLFVSLVAQTEGEEKVKLYASLVSEITADHSDRPLLRLKFLNNIFNAEQAPQVRYNAFLNICSLSLSSSSSSLLVPLLPKIRGWVEAWGLGGEEVRRLYKSILGCLKATKENQLKLYDFLLYVLTTVEKSSPEEDLEEEAVEAVGLALKLVEVKDFDEVVDLKSVRELSQGQHAPLVKLLDIFAKGTVGDFNSFEKENDGFFAAHDLDKTELLNKMRFIAIAAMGSKKKCLPFAELVKELGVDEEEVELWVLDAVEKGYVQAKIDELAGVVVIRQAHLRLFGEEEWKQLQGDLTRAEKNLKQVHNSIDKSLSSAPYIRK